MTRRPVVPLLALALTACEAIRPTEPGSEFHSEAAAPGGFGTTQDLQIQFGGTGNNGLANPAGQPFSDRIFALMPGPDTTAINQEFTDWFSKVVLADLTGTKTDMELLRAVADFFQWYDAAGVYARLYGGAPEVRFAKELALWEKIAAPIFRRAIRGNIAFCGENRSMGALANSIFWFHIAVGLYLSDLSILKYDADTLRAEISDGCAAVMLTQVDLPLVLDIGSSYTMRLTFAVGLGLPAAPSPAAFDVQMTSSEFTIQQPGGFTDPAGVIERAVRPDVAGIVEIAVRACLVLPNRTTATPYVCGDEFITRQAQVIVPPPPPPPPPPSNCSGTLTALSPVQVVTPAHLSTIANFQTIDGNLFIQGDPTLLTVNLPCLRTVTGVLAISNAFGLTSASFPALVEVGRQFNIVSNPALTTLSLPALQQIGTVPTAVGALGIGNNPVLANLIVGAVTIHRNVQSQLGGMQLTQPLALTQLNGLSTAISVDTLFFTLPADTTLRSQFRAYKAAAPGVLNVCELPFGGGGARVCLQ